jgi:hypothetical protein
MKCPECNREMRDLNDHPSQFRCDYCEATWDTVCDHCMGRACWEGSHMCEKHRQAGTKTLKQNRYSLSRGQR